MSFPLHLLRNPHPWVDELSSCAPGPPVPWFMAFSLFVGLFSSWDAPLSLCCCCISKTLICFAGVGGGGAGGCSDCLIEVRSLPALVCSLPVLSLVVCVLLCSRPGPGFPGQPSLQTFCFFVSVKCPRNLITVASKCCLPDCLSYSEVAQKFLVSMHS